MVDQEKTKELEAENIWLELDFFNTEDYLLLEEKLKGDKRVRGIFVNTSAIIHSKDLKSFLNEFPFKPDIIQSLGEANLNDDLMSISSIQDILNSQEFTRDFLDNSTCEKMAQSIRAYCIDLVNNLPVEEIATFDMNIADSLVEKEAELRLLPLYLEYRKSLKEKYLEKDNKLQEKINKIEKLAEGI